MEVIVGQELEGLGLQRLRLLLEDALTLSPAELVVDLRGSRRLDVNALHVLLDAHTRLLRTGGRLSLRAVSESHARSIALAGLHPVFSVAEEPADGDLQPPVPRPVQPRDDELGPGAGLAALVAAP